MYNRQSVDSVKSPVGLHGPGYTHKLQSYAILIDQSLPVEQQNTFLYGKHNHPGQPTHRKNSYTTGSAS